MQQKEILYDTQPMDEARSELHCVQARLLQSLRVQEEFWKQKARTKWLTDGDCNSKFFHALVRDKRSKLAIHRIKTGQQYGSSQKSK